MKNIFFGLGLLSLICLPIFSANALMPPKPIEPIDNTKVIFAPEIKPILEPIIEPETIVPYIPIKIPDLVIPPELLQGPSITDINVAANDNSALIEWKTSRPATSKVEYGLTSSYTKTLEDKELVSDHAMAIPAATGELHIRISSNDSLNRHSETQDITVIIPKPVTPPETDESTDVVADADSATDVVATEDETGLTDDQNTADASGIKPILEINGVEAPSEPQGGLSATNAILGGLALLLAGVLIGVLVKTGSKKE